MIPAVSLAELSIGFIDVPQSFDSQWKTDSIAIAAEVSILDFMTLQLGALKGRIWRIIADIAARISGEGLDLEPSSGFRIQASQVSPGQAARTSPMKRSTSARRRSA